MLEKWHCCWLEGTGYLCIPERFRKRPINEKGNKHITAAVLSRFMNLIQRIQMEAVNGRPPEQRRRESLIF